MPVASQLPFIDPNRDIYLFSFLSYYREVGSSNPPEDVLKSALFPLCPLASHFTLHCHCSPSSKWIPDAWDSDGNCMTD